MKINKNCHSAASKPADFNQPPLTNRVNKRVSTAGIIRLSFITAPLLLDYTAAAFITSSPFISADCRSCIFSQARITPHLEQTGKNKRLKNNEGAKPTKFYFILSFTWDRSALLDSNDGKWWGRQRWRSEFLPEGQTGPPEGAWSHLGAP